MRTARLWTGMSAALVAGGLAAGCDRAGNTPTSPSPPPAVVTVAALTVAPASVLAGADAAGTVTLSAPAPAGGASVTLVSSHPAATVPDSVDIPADATTATFAIATHHVADHTPVTANVTAAAGGATRTAALEVRPVPRQAVGFAVEPDRIRGGQPALGRVSLGTFATAATPDGTVPAAVADVIITLTSRHQAVQVPPSVTVPGGQLEATFPIETQEVPQTLHVVLTASSGGETRTTGMHVLPAGPTLTGLTPNTGQVGTAIVVTLTGSAFIPGDTTVSVGGAALVGVSDVTVADRTTLTATFNIDATATPGTYPVTVETGGGASESRPFTVTAVPVSSPAPPSTTLSASVQQLALSVNAPGADPALPGNARLIRVSNTGSSPASAVQVSVSGLPTGTSVTSNTCTGTMAAGTSCDITITPGATASPDNSGNACTTTPGTEPEAATIAVTAGNAAQVDINVVVLGIGCIHQGGFLFAVDDTTPNTGSIGGKVAALADEPNSLSWATIFDNTAADSLTDGTSNTNVLATPGGQYPAAQACANKTDQGFSNWHLPAVCELGRFVGVGSDAGCGATNPNLYTGLHTNNLGGFANSNYWSSTEGVADPTSTAWAQDFTSGSLNPVSKALNLRVRCVRRFTP